MPYKNNTFDEKKFTYEYFCQENVCRLCWEISDNALSLKKETILVTLIEKHIGFTVSGHILQAICSVCADELRYINDFKELCLQLDEKVQGIIAAGLTRRNSSDECKEFKDLLKEDVSQQAKLELQLLNNSVLKDERESLLSDLDKHPFNYNKELQFIYESGDEFLPIDDNYCYLCSVEFSSHALKTKHDEEVHKIKQESFYKCYTCRKIFPKLSQKIKHEIQCSFSKQLKTNKDKSTGINMYSENSKQNSVHKNNVSHNGKLENILEQNIQLVLDDEFENFDEELWSSDRTENKRSKVQRRKKYKCRQCDDRFEKKEDLKTHVATHPKAVDRPGICEVCGKVFSLFRNLQAHLKIHYNFKQVKCPHCDLRCTLPDTMKSHIRRVHMGERRFSCHLCPQLFFAESIKAKHLRNVHYQVRNFKCHICNKSYKTKREMLRHIQTIHEGMKLVKCPHCRARFMKQSALEQHVAKHN